MGPGPVHVGSGHALAGLIRMHRADALCASPREQRHPVAAGLAGARLREAADIAAELRRAINRQRNELGRLRSIERRMLPLPGPPPGSQPDDPPPAPAPVTYDRKSYAPDPIGKVTPRADLAPAAAAPARVESFQRVTNLGTRIDVLA